jgi:hypothetical protein
MNVIKINKSFLLFLKGYLIKEMENFFPRSYRVIETLVEVWQKLEIAWKHSQFVLVFPRNFSFLPNFHACFCNYRNTENVFYFLNVWYYNIKQKLSKLYPLLAREEIFLKFYLKRFNVFNRFNAIIQIVPQLYCTETECPLTSRCSKFWNDQVINVSGGILVNRRSLLESLQAFINLKSISIYQISINRQPLYSLDYVAQAWYATWSWL